MTAAQETAFLAAHTVSYYPAITTDSDTSCAVLEPRLCSLPVEQRAGTERTINYVDMCSGATSAEEPVRTRQKQQQ